jgi:diguanylate cyclase (GGDEF)-like protein
MTGIDPKTILLIASTLGIVMALVLHLLQRSYPPSIRGLGLWAKSMVMGFVAGALFATTGLWPPLLSVTLPSLLVYLSPYVSYLGTQRFFGVSQKHWPWLLMILLAVLTSAWFTYVDANFGRRLQLSSFVMVTVCAAHARLMWQRGRHSLAGQIALGVLIVGAGIQVMRFVTTLIYPAGQDVMNASPENVIYLSSFSFAIVLLSISQILLATDRLRDDLQHAATHDALTDALTRRYLNDALQRELSRCQRHNRKMSVLLLDIDHFKAINDKLGHQEGDRVLVDFVSQINGYLRSGDLLGRFGGEEFVVLLPETGEDVARIVAERIRAAVEAQGGATVSIGVTTKLPNADTVDALLSRADGAMYRAKAKGRNRVEVA